MIFRVEANEPELINVFTAPKEKLQPLRERVTSGGWVNMLMHAYLVGDPEEYGRYPTLPGYEEKRDAIVQASPEEPVIIGEEAHTVKSLPLRIKRRFASPPKQIYACTTEYSRANPQEPGLLHSLRRKAASWFNQSQRQEAWDQFAIILDWLGVKNVALGGQYLTYIDVNAYPKDSKTGRQLKKTLEELAEPGRGRIDVPDETSDNIFLPSTCVGCTALNLAYRGFNVALTLPSSPKKIIKLYAGD